MLFVERTNELAVQGKVKAVKAVAIVKARVNNPIICRALDPKPSELLMIRLKAA